MAFRSTVAAVTDGPTERSCICARDGEAFGSSIRYLHIYGNANSTQMMMEFMGLKRELFCLTRMDCDEAEPGESTMLAAMEAEQA